jgi:hypothetical protein
MENNITPDGMIIYDGADTESHLSFKSTRGGPL